VAGSLGKNHFPREAFEQLLALFIEKAEVHLEFPLPFIVETGKSNEFDPEGVSRRAEALEDTPQIVILVEDVLLDVVAKKKARDFWQVEVH
jgi:hypothetical protein